MTAAEKLYYTSKKLYTCASSERKPSCLIPSHKAGDETSCRGSVSSRFRSGVWLSLVPRLSARTQTALSLHGYWRVFRVRCCTLTSAIFLGRKNVVAMAATAATLPTPLWSAVVYMRLLTQTRLQHFLSQFSRDVTLKLILKELGHDISLLLNLQL